MAKWFEVRIKYEKFLENGNFKKGTESYLVDALSFTEAEQIYMDEIKSFIGGELSVVGIKRTRLAEIMSNPNGDTFYKCKVNLVTLDEKAGIEKAKAIYILVKGSTIEEAIQVLNKGMEGTISDYEIVAVSRTNILDVFPTSSNSIKEVILT